MQLRGDLDARGPPPADDERQQPSALLGRRLRQRRALEALADVAAQPRGVLDRLEEEGVLLVLELFFLWGEGEEREGKRERERESEQEKKMKQKKGEETEPKKKAPRRP